MAATILVLSGNSGVGSETVRQLRALGHEVRAGVRDSGKARALGNTGAEVVPADLSRPETLETALRGIRDVVLSTAADPDLANLHRSLHAPAKAAGVERVLRISVVGADSRAKTLLGRAHGAADEELRNSGLGWTILRPHSFMQNLLASAGTIAREGRFYNCTAQGRVPLIDVRDIAAAAVACIARPETLGKVYDLTGPEAVSMDDVSAALTEATGREIRYADVPPSAWIAGAVQAGLPEWLARDLAFYSSEIFAKGRGERVSPAVRELTGRDAISIRQFARDHVAAFASTPA
jgi:uncharacterized protein YbjT (DUF2867 family)